VSSLPSFNVLGVRVAVTDYARASQRVIEAAQRGEKFAASALAVHAVMEARRDAGFRARLNSLDLAVPDGQPVRWALGVLHGQHLADRVYGPLLMLRICADAAEAGLPVFLFGSTASTLDRLQASLRDRFPGLIIAGARASRFREIGADEADADAAAIRASGARLVFCGLGCPRQEYWVHAMRPRLDVPLIAVGAAFALWAGERAMAPGWMQRAGLEWLFRLAQEPRRLAHRYFVYNPWFIAALLRQKFSPDAYPVVSDPAPPRFFG
jgi:N-acetylglucosaminyldiphosphoundecaprenol N-acetyl-beta-D-mannosaminyltransferase